MEDNQIVELYWQREEKAISATAVKYGKYCYTIANNILLNHEDADESVNDTYLAAWKAMPPHRPSILSVFLGKLTRRISLNRWRKSSAQKRGGGEVTLALEELSECVVSGDSPERYVEAKELARTLNAFVGTLPETERDIFLSRYWFLASIREISEKFDFSESRVKSQLMRTREKLRKTLQEEGLL